MEDPIQLLLLVWNRREYTQQTLDSLLDNTTYPFQLHIVDNASDEETAEFLKEWVSYHPLEVRSFVRSKENEGLSIPTQRFWDQMQSEGRPWWGKIDNDILFSSGWLSRLVEVMEKCPSVAVASVCHYPRDFEREVQAQGGVFEENGVRYYPRSHTGGCGYLLRASDQKLAGNLSTTHGKIYGWSMYQHLLNRKGRHTAYAYPLVPVKHLGAWEGQANTSAEYEEYAKKVKQLRVEGQEMGRKAAREALSKCKK